MGHDVGGHGAGSGDPSELPQAAHVPVSRLTIGAWNLVAKSDEHVLLSFYWAERKLVWEVLHLSVVRKMELDFEDVVKMELSTPHPDEPERLVVELLEERGGALRLLDREHRVPVHLAPLALRGVGEVARLAADAAEDLHVVEREADEDLAEEVGGEAEEDRHRRKTASQAADG